MSTEIEAPGVDPAFPWAHFINFDPHKLIDALDACNSADVTYGLGDKAGAWTSTPGADFTSIDCSGFVGWALSHATSGSFDTFRELGSVDQHDWLEAQGFKNSSIGACFRHDDVLRIAFLPPHAIGPVGHVALVLNGYTLESHGEDGRGVAGPDSRGWTGLGWQAHTLVYALTAPEPEAK
jgi:hypothetical protein